jgi:hypothetical protein
MDGSKDTLGAADGLLYLGTTTGMLTLDGYAVEPCQHFEGAPGTGQVEVLLGLQPSPAL